MGIDAVQQPFAAGADWARHVGCGAEFVEVKLRLRLDAEQRKCSEPDDHSSAGRKRLQNSHSFYDFRNIDY